MNENRLILSSSPHLHSANTTRRIMLDVIIALVPALAAAVIFFGWRALLLCAVSASACVLFEWAYRKVMKLDCTVCDLSAVVTGLLLALVCPVSLPLWILVIGDFFAIVVVKQLFGGIGKNFVNPALAARALMFVSWATAMTDFGTAAESAAPSAVSGSGFVIDAVSSATPMGILNKASTDGIRLADMFFGKIGGCIGETCAIALLLGFVYLVIRKVITVRIPLSYILTVAVIAFAFPQGGSSLSYRLTWCAAQVLGGGLLLGAIFMATDYVTSPVTGLGQVLYGIGCGLITVAIRYFFTYPEGVTFAILLMNACSGIFDRFGRLPRFGAVKRKEGAGV